jgi:hypothetical protein
VKEAMWETTMKRASENLATCERATKTMRRMTDPMLTTAVETEVSGTMMHLDTHNNNHYLEQKHQHGAEQESLGERQRRRQIWLALQHRWNQWFVAPSLWGLDERRHTFQRCLAQMDRIICDQDSIGQSAATINEWWFFHQQFATLPRYQQIAFRELASHAFFRNNGLITDAAVARWVVL